MHPGPGPHAKAFAGDLWPAFLSSVPPLPAVAPGEAEGPMNTLLLSIPVHFYLKAPTPRKLPKKINTSTDFNHLLVYSINFHCHIICYAHLSSFLKPRSWDVCGLVTIKTKNWTVPSSDSVYNWKKKNAVHNSALIIIMLKIFLKTKITDFNEKFSQSASKPMFLMKHVNVSKLFYLFFYIISNTL